MCAGQSDKEYIYLGVVVCNEPGFGDGGFDIFLNPPVLNMESAAELATRPSAP